MRFLLRPIYRIFFARSLWEFLAHVKGFFFAELNGEVSQMRAEVSRGNAKTYDLEARLQAMEQKLQAIEQGTAVQWDGLEQLLLALYRQPEQPPRHEEQDGARHTPALPEGR